MNLLKALIKLGLIENTDFVLDASAAGFSMLQKTRTVETAPAVLDEQGNVVTPAQYGEETYTPDAPSQEQLDQAWLEVQRDEISAEDVVLLINEYLKGKEALKDELDCLNVVDNRIHAWDFKNIPRPSIPELHALINISKENVSKAELIKEKADKGRKAREACEKVLDLVAGFNLDRDLTVEQITQMQSTFANAEAALRAGRPTYAKTYISAITADDVLVTQEMKDLCLELLAGY